MPPLSYRLMKYFLTTILFLSLCILYSIWWYARLSLRFPECIVPHSWSSIPVFHDDYIDSRIAEISFQTLIADMSGAFSYNELWNALTVRFPAFSHEDNTTIRHLINMMKVKKPRVLIVDSFWDDAPDFWILTEFSSVRAYNITFYTYPPNIAVSVSWAISHDLDELSLTLHAPFPLGFSLAPFLDMIRAISEQHTIHSVRIIVWGESFSYIPIQSDLDLLAHIRTQRLWVSGIGMPRMLTESLKALAHKSLAPFIMIDSIFKKENGEYFSIETAWEVSE